MDNVSSLPTTLSILYLKRFVHRGHTGLQANPAHQFFHSQLLGMANISTHSAPVCNVVKDLQLSRAGEPCGCTLRHSLRNTEHQHTVCPSREAPGPTHEEAFVDQGMQSHQSRSHSCPSWC